MNRAIERARSLLGTPFRLQGRQPNVALDCVGLIIEAYELAADAYPRTYRLSGHDLQDVEPYLDRAFDEIEAKEARAGDLFVLRCARERLHFGIAAQEGLIHADAALGQIVLRPWPLEWPIARAYRQRQRRN